MKLKMDTETDVDSILRQIEEAEVNDLIKEIARAIVEVRLMQAGKIPILTLNDV